jgi:hypothetical protein
MSRGQGRRENRADETVHQRCKLFSDIYRWFCKSDNDTAYSPTGVKDALQCKNENTVLFEYEA